MTQTAAGQPLLEVTAVTKSFGALVAVNGLSFNLNEGEVLGIGGPNGAGKTTLFEVISGLSPATSGSVRFAGEDITRLSAEAICHAGIARTFQLNAAFDSLSVRENVEVAAQFGRANRAVPGLRLDRCTRASVDAALEITGLIERQRRIAAKLPVIDRKLLMIAGALATEPRLVLMDEPVGGLTPGETDRIVHLVERLRAEGRSIIMIEHVMRFLVQLSDRVLILHHGEKIYEGVPRGLVQDAQVVDVFLGQGASRRLASYLEGRA
ncbi:MAG: ABC transporter ATP-binding protein [Alphaproteobacteria bacterium]|nr:ABC transporter ATP-binding protein [Alphaproteobacteria bacterium]